MAGSAAQPTSSSAAPTNRDSQSASNRSPALWNPDIASALSVLLSPAFGALIHASNWRALGNPIRARTSTRYAAFTLALLAFSAFVLPYITAPRQYNSIAFGISLWNLVIWYIALGKPQEKHVKQTFCGAYPRRGWARPVFYAVLSFVGLVVIGIGIDEVMLALLRQ